MPGGANPGAARGSGSRDNGHRHLRVSVQMGWQSVEPRAKARGWRRYLAACALVIAVGALGVAAWGRVTTVDDALSPAHRRYGLRLYEQDRCLEAMIQSSVPRNSRVAIDPRLTQPWWKQGLRTLATPWAHVVLESQAEFVLSLRGVYDSSPACGTADASTPRAWYPAGNRYALVVTRREAPAR
jgi:hypothetical protein